MATTEYLTTFELQQISTSAICLRGGPKNEMLMSIYYEAFYTTVEAVLEYIFDPDEDRPTLATNVEGALIVRDDSC